MTTATDHLVAAGAAPVAGPTVTPWGSVNARLDAPGDLQITVFQELEHIGPAEHQGAR